MRLIPFLSVTVEKTLAAISLLIFVCPSFEASFALAQGNTAIASTTGAGSLGTTVTADGPTVQITGGTRPGNGTNLFHSFDQFSVGTGDTAQFLNTTQSLRTDNILCRVTGGTLSSIFGTIDTLSYPEANLFLMNPAGIIFGPNAMLDVSGSIAFTTANYLRLADANGSNAGIFHGDPTATSLLTTASVAAFGFLSTNPTAIAVQDGKLTVQPSHSLSLIGGNVTIQSSTLGNSIDPPTSAPGKQVLIASVASPGEILAGTLTPAVNINGQLPGTLGTVQISQGSTIDTRGEGGGTILIRGGRLVVDGSVIGSNTGDILLASDSTLIKNSAQIITFTTTTTNAGHITLEASKDIDMESNASVESLSAGALGDAGNITVRSNQGNINFSNEAFVTSQQTSNGGGNSGSIEVDAPHGDIRLDHSLIFTSAGEGTATIGGIRISTNNLHLLNGSRIDGDNFSTQVAGNIDILVKGLLRLTGSSEIETTAVDKAPAADLIIKAQEIRIADGSKLSADTTSSSSGNGGSVSIRSPVGPSTLITIDGLGSGIFTNTKGTGKGGTVSLLLQSLTLQNGGTISAETLGVAPSAAGGSIIVKATDHVTMTDDASITARSTGPADAGNIEINAGKQLGLTGTSTSKSSITTEATQARGGNIEIIAIDRVRLVDGEISTSVRGGSGSGGNITIDPNTVILQNSAIFAQAVRGKGGDITITTPLLLSDSLSRIDASTPFGLNGTVTIQSPNAPISGKIQPLNNRPLLITALLNQPCAAVASGNFSSFTVAGRDTLPLEPGGWLSSPLELDAPGHHGATMTNTGLRAGLDDPTGKLPILSLRRITPPGFLTRAFAAPSSAGCAS
jgi:filamentous hemagglutinin family protein